MKIGSRPIKTRGGCLPIDPSFQKTMKKVGKEKDIAVWGPVNSPEKLGIRGTYVTVDWDLCTGCGVCLEVCPLQVYEWVDTPGHPTSQRKAFPAREPECVQCYRCETQCPMQAIRIDFFLADCQGPTGWLFSLVAYLVFVLPLVAMIYGVWFGPVLGLLPLFYGG